MRFYFFTSHLEMDKIIQTGIQPKNILSDITAGGKGVLLTTDKDPKEVTTVTAPVLKQRFRICVEIPARSPFLYKWDKWAKEHGINRKQKNLLNKTYGDTSTWFVHEGVVTNFLIRQVLDSTRGLILSIKANGKYIIRESKNELEDKSMSMETSTKPQMSEIKAKHLAITEDLETASKQCSCSQDKQCSCGIKTIQE